MTDDPTADALRVARLEAKRKLFGFSGTYRDHTREVEHEPYRSDLLELRRCITMGQPIPERMYRKDVDSTYDELLELKGVKHLHLGGKDSNVLVYLVEYANFVVVLEINNHKHVDKQPIGEILRGALMSPLGSAKLGLQAQVDEKSVSAAETLKRALLPRRTKD